MCPPPNHRLGEIISRWSGGHAGAQRILCARVWLGRRDARHQQIAGVEVPGRCRSDSLANVITVCGESLRSIVRRVDGRIAGTDPRTTDAARRGLAQPRARELGVAARSRLSVSYRRRSRVHPPDRWRAELGDRGRGPCVRWGPISARAEEGREAVDPGAWTIEPSRRARRSASTRGDRGTRFDALGDRPRTADRHALIGRDRGGPDDRAPQRRPRADS